MAKRDSQVLSWLHFGDLHLTDAGEQNHRDFAALVAAANRHLAGHIDFAVLPGDNADDGSEEQFRLVADIAKDLRIPLHILPGDHDFKQRSLAGFYDVLGAAPLPYAIVVKGHRCVFLDVVARGTGGPDFRLEAEQLEWLEQEFQSARNAGEAAVLFMHPYPADLRVGAQELTALIARYEVAVVDMGHTHYNELANDGITIFAATRSTGQIEEGPVGFSILSIDQGVVSWSFKPLVTPWPLVQITTPADIRLITDRRASPEQTREGFVVRAKVWGAVPIDEVTFEFANAAQGPMVPVHVEPDLWQAVVDASEGYINGVCPLKVRARDADGHRGEDTIQVRVDQSRWPAMQVRCRDGSDRDSIGAWPEKGILGTQLGPNRNGRKW